MTTASPSPDNPESDNPGRDDGDTWLMALVRILALHGIRASADSLVAGLPIPGKLDEGGLLRLMDSHGMQASLRTRRLDEISDALLPVMLILSDGRACVLESRQPGGNWSVTHPDFGNEPVLIDANHIAADYSGRCWLIKPRIVSDGRGDQIQPELHGHWFWSVVFRFKSYYVQSALAAVAVNILALASTLFVMNVYDRVVSTQAYVTLWTLAVGTMIAAVFEFGLRNLRAWLLDLAAKKEDLLLGSALFRHTMRVRLDARPESAGAFANLLREFESVREFTTSSTLSALIDLPFLFLFLFVIAYIAGPLVWVPVIAMPVVTIVAVLVQWPMARLVVENLREATIRHGVLVESLESAEAIKSMQAEGMMQRRYEQSTALTAMTAMKSRVLSNLVMNFTYTVGIVCTVAIVVWGVYLIGDGKLTLGALIGTVMLSGRALYPIGAIATMAVRFQQARTSLASLNRVMKMPTDREPGREYLIRPIFEGGIELANVNFKYGPESPLALSSVALKIQAGEKVAILGRVGSGKSTLLKVIAGLYRAQSGQVLLDGIDVGQIEPANVRRNVIYLGQEAQLFYGSMAENLKAGRPLASDEEMVEAARVCGAHAFISTHPRGYGMTVGEGGGGMSGGQRQAVAAARLLLARPQVMLLDEPTSAMDQATELSVMTALRRAAGTRTMILVTHKLSLLDYVDRVIVLDSGMVVANGPKAEVLKALAEGQVRKALAPTK